MIEDEAGKHFDPAVVDAFRKRFRDFLEIRKRCGIVEENLIPA